MKITFLGTGTSMGVPVIACDCEVCASENNLDKRYRSSILIEIKNKKIVIDVGPDFRNQALTENIKMVDAILLTHEHRDHIAGLDDVRSYNYISGIPMDVYAESRVHDAVRTTFEYAFRHKKYPGIPEFNLININEEPFFIDDLKVIPIRVLHYILPILGYRINNFCYITDIKSIAESEYNKLSGLDVLVISGLRKEEHYSHFSLSDSLDFINRINPKRSYITHISHQMGIHQVIQKELPANIFLAYDGLQVEC